MASLAYHHVEHGQTIMSLNQVSNAIYFIQQGQIEVSYKDDDRILLLFENGSYIGDTSLIYGIRNQYNYCLKNSCRIEKSRIYNLE